MFRTCAKCGKHSALFTLKSGRRCLRRDSKHDLCPRCFRSLKDRILVAVRIDPYGVRSGTS